MGNTDNPHGFLPVHVLGGGELYTRIFTKDASDATGIGIGDPVDTDGTLDGVEEQAAAGTITGVSMSYGAISTLSYHPVVIPLGRTVFECQEDANAGTASEGLTSDFLAGTASTVTGRSQYEMDSSEVNTTNTHDLRLIQVAPYPDNDGTASYARWFVLFNNERWANQIAGY
jgi:hypothetical protein